MLDYELIKKMNSKNVSVDQEKTKEIMRILWNDITKEQKNRAVEIGGFSSTRSFNKTRKTGLISVRMVLALSVALEINPFYFTGEDKNINGYSEEKIKLFIESKNMINKINTNEFEIMKSSLLNSFNEVIDNLDMETIQDLNNLEKEEILTLIDSLFIKEKLGDKRNRTLLIKLILTR